MYPRSSNYVVSCFLCLPYFVSVAPPSGRRAPLKTTGSDLPGTLGLQELAPSRPSEWSGPATGAPWVDSKRCFKLYPHACVVFSVPCCLFSFARLLFACAQFYHFSWLWKQRTRCSKRGHSKLCYEARTRCGTPLIAMHFRPHRVKSMLAPRRIHLGA